jgi:hypothetical protein
MQRREGRILLDLEEIARCRDVKEKKREDNTASREGVDVDR